MNDVDKFDAINKKIDSLNGTIYSLLSMVMIQLDLMKISTNDELFRRISITKEKLTSELESGELETFAKDNNIKVDVKSFVSGMDCLEAILKLKCLEREKKWFDRIIK